MIMLSPFYKSKHAKALFNIGSYEVTILGYKDNIK